MSYPRLSFGFSSILYLNTQFIARYLIFTLYVNSRWNERFLGSFWSREKKNRKMAGTSRRRVNEKSKSTSDQRRDVNAISALTSLKAKGPKIDGGIRKRIDEGTKSIAAVTQISGEDTCFCIFFFSEKRLMIYRLIKCIIKSSMF